MSIQTQLQGFHGPKSKGTSHPVISEETKYLQREMRNALDKVQGMLETSSSAEEKKRVLVMKVIDKEKELVRNASNVWDLLVEEEHPVIVDAKEGLLCCNTCSRAFHMFEIRPTQTGRSNLIRWDRPKAGFVTNRGNIDWDHQTSSEINAIAHTTFTKI